MFTGIISALGTLVYLDKTYKDGTQGLALGCTSEQLDFHQIKPGASIAVNGVCLTVTRCEGEIIFFDVSHETLAKTNLNHIKLNQQVNLEPAVKFSDSIDGHLVSGHVDGIAEIIDTYKLGNAQGFVIKPPKALLPLLAVKGSVCLDGTSLTVNQIRESCFIVDIIPFTQQQTIIQHYHPGYKANIEVDLIARYVARILEYKN